MGIVVTIITVALVLSVCKGDDTCRNSTSCPSCVEKGKDCYWCPQTGKCTAWDWSNYPDCKGHKYYYKQCDLTGLDLIMVFSVALFLLVVAIVSCCICICCCCCCCKGRDRRRGYELVPRTERESEDGRNERNDTVQHARVHVTRRIEIHRNYGATTNDSTAENFSSSLP